MTNFTSKFSINEKAFCLIDNKVHQVTIYGIGIAQYANESIEIRYHVKFNDDEKIMVDESELFHTKEELLKSL